MSFKDPMFFPTSSLNMLLNRARLFGILVVLVLLSPTAVAFSSPLKYAASTASPLLTTNISPFPSQPNIRSSTFQKTTRLIQMSDQSVDPGSGKKKKGLFARVRHTSTVLIGQNLLDRSQAFKQYFPQHN